MPVIVAQALAEKGTLDGGIVSGLAGFLTGTLNSTFDFVQERPYLLIVLVVVLFLLLKKRR